MKPSPMRAAFIGALLLCAMAMAQSPADRIQRAIRLTREKDYAAARRELRGITPPSTPQALIAFHRLRAAIASGLAEHAEAAREMRNALAFAPADSDLLLATAVAEQQAGLLDGAFRHADAARTAAPNATAETLSGDLEEARGHYVEAVKAYQRAVEIAPADEQYRLNLALELVRHHTFDPAAAVLEQAAAIFPRSPRIRTLLGVAYYALSKVDQAVAALVAALDVDPQFIPAREYLARIAFDAPTANPRALDALCKRPDSVCAAARLRADRDDQSAFADLRRLIKPDDGAGRCELARAYEWRSEWTAARAEMEACVKSSPDNPQHHYRLARIYQRLGLDGLARREAELQRQTALADAGEIERRERAVQTFQWVVKQ